MRVLFLTPELPYPPDSGGRIKTLSLLDYLRLRHEVSVLCFRRRPLSDEQSRWAAEAGVADSVPLSRGRSVLNLARSYLAGVPLSIERNRSQRLRALVAERSGAAKFDALFVDGWLMAQYLPDRFAGLRLLHEHNAEYVMWRRQAQLEHNRLRRLLVRTEYRRVRAYESRMLGLFDVIFAVSEGDREALLELGGRADRVRVLPNLPDPALLDRPALSFTDAQPAVLYHGTLSWQPNIEGLDRFLRDLFPLVLRRAPEARFLVAGRGAPPWLERLARGTPGAQYLGPVEDAEPLYRRARVFVEATRSGGGTKLKALNALARGLPTVCSPQAAEGIDATSGEHLLIAPDDESMADAIVRLMNDPALWQTLSENGRALVRSRYVAEVAYLPLDEVLSGARAKA